MVFEARATRRVPYGPSGQTPGTPDAFRNARREYRNALSHASPFTVGYDADGTYLPGLLLLGSSGLATSAMTRRSLHGRSRGEP